MTVEEVRTRFLNFYAARGHAVLPSAPIVPGNDPTTLFTSSGMQPLVPYLLGKEHPSGARLVDSQLSFRAGDIEEVGDNRHTTFFEMLGNWSLGDYFKQEQIPWVFEFITSQQQGIGLDPSRLYITVFSGDSEAGMAQDDEAVALWQQLFSSINVNAAFAAIGSEAAGYERGMKPDERIFAYDAKKNWWSRAGVPANMPAGEPGGPDTEMFYDFMPESSFDGGHAYVEAVTEWGANCHPNCDCGRFVEIGNSVFMQYVKEADGSFSPLPKQNVDFGGGLERLTFATIGIPDAFRIDVFDAARTELETRAGTPYGEHTATTRAMRIVLDHLRAATFILAEGVTPSNTEAGYIVRRLIRRAIREVDRLGISGSVLGTLAEHYAHAYASAYPHVAAALPAITAALTQEEAQFRTTLTQGLKEFDRIAQKGTVTGEDLFVLFTSYGFPQEMTRELVAERSLTITDEEALEKKLAEHRAKSREGGAQRFAGGLADHGEQTVRYHTLHHILLKALQIVLGPEVKQRGSNITSERLRIDFTSPAKMTDEQKTEVERIVNEVIQQDLPVSRTMMPKAEAEKLGAEMEFGVTYPDMVTVYSVGPVHATPDAPAILEAFSREFCGGPHVENTATIHDSNRRFRIAKEEAVASGIRRIKAILE